MTTFLKDKITDDARNLLKELCPLNAGANWQFMGDSFKLSVPAFSPATKAMHDKSKTIESKVYEFALETYTQQAVHHFALALAGLSKCSDYKTLPRDHNNAVYLSNLTYYAIPILRGETPIKIVKDTSKDYHALCCEVGLDYLTEVEGVEFHSHSNGSAKQPWAITVEVPRAARELVESSLTRDSNYKNLFKIMVLHKQIEFNIMKTSILDDEGEEVIGFKYRFTETR